VVDGVISERVEDRLPVKPLPRGAEVTYHLLRVHLRQLLSSDEIVRVRPATGNTVALDGTFDALVAAPG
jgi:hypothetical protein